MRKLFVIFGLLLGLIGVAQDRTVLSGNTLTNLLSLTPNNTMTNVFVVGTTNVNDGGQGMFTYIRGSVLATNASNIYAPYPPNAANGRWVLQLAINNIGMSNITLFNPNIIGGSTTNSTNGSVTFTGTVTNIDFTPNTNLVIVAPYQPAIGGAANFGATSGTAYEGITDVHYYRIRQTGTISQVRVYASVLTGLSAVYAKVWRTNALGTFDLVGTSDNFLPSLVAGVTNLVNLATPITSVQEGDYQGFRFEYSTATVQNFVAYTGAPTGSVWVTTSTPGTVGYNWHAQTQLSGFAFPLEAYMRAPSIVGFGDSIISGGFTNTAFTTNNGSNPFNTALTITYNAAQRLGGITFQNMGVPGNTTTLELARVTNDVINLHPKAVILEGGVNDLNSVVAIGTITNNLTSIANALTTAGIKIIWCRVFPSGSTSTDKKPLQQFIEQRSLSTDSILVDADPYVGTANALTDAYYYSTLQSGYDSGDHLHPNAAGMILIGQAVADACRIINPERVIGTSAVNPASSTAKFYSDTGTNGLFVGWDTNRGAVTIFSQSGGGKTNGPIVMNPQGPGGLAVNLGGTPMPDGYGLGVGGNAFIKGYLNLDNGVGTTGGPLVYPKAGVFLAYNAPQGYVLAYDPATTYKKLNLWGNAIDIAPDTTSGLLVSNNVTWINSQHSFVSSTAGILELRQNYNPFSDRLVDTSKASWVQRWRGDTAADGMVWFRGAPTASAPTYTGVMVLTNGPGLWTPPTYSFPAAAIAPTFGQATSWIMASGTGFLDSRDFGASAWLPMQARALNFDFRNGGAATFLYVPGTWVTGGATPPSNQHYLGQYVQSGTAHILTASNSTYFPLSIEGSSITISPATVPQVRISAGGVTVVNAFTNSGGTNVPARFGAGGLLTNGLTSLSSEVSGNLPVNNLNSGSGASSSTFWRGDGTWGSISASSLSGILPEANGGTGAALNGTGTIGGLLYQTISGTAMAIMTNWVKTSSGGLLQRYDDNPGGSGTIDFQNYDTTAVNHHTELTYNFADTSGGTHEAAETRAGQANTWTSTASTQNGYYIISTLNAGGIEPRFVASSALVAATNSDFHISTSGKGLFVKVGAQSRLGTLTLVAGTVTVANITIAATDHIFLQLRTVGGTVNQAPSYTINPGTSFTVTGAATDTSTYDYFIVGEAP